RDQRVELDALDRPHRLPLLAARAVPDQAPRAVSAVRAAVSRARQREAAERGRDPLHGARLLGRVRRPKLVDIDETREDLVAHDEALDAPRERFRLRKLADDRGIGEIPLELRLLRGQPRNVLVEAVEAARSRALVA